MFRERGKKVSAIWTFTFILSFFPMSDAMVLVCADCWEYVLPWELVDGVYCPYCCESDDDFEEDEEDGVSSDEEEVEDEEDGVSSDEEDYE